MSEHQLTKAEKNLLDFEDTIRLEALPLEESLRIKRESSEDIFVVGAGIKEYLNELRKLGFKDLWQELEKNEMQSVNNLLREKVKMGEKASNALLMYTYIDFVLNKTSGHIMIFLPKKNGLIATGEDAGPTFDEITRALTHFSDKSERIHFVTGLYDEAPSHLSLLIASAV